MVNKDGERIEGQSVSFEYGTVNQSTVTIEHEQGTWSYDKYTVKGSENANTLFTFMADNTDVEFSYAVFGREEGQTSNVLTTIHNVKAEGGMRDVLMKEYMEGHPMIENTHSHSKQYKDRGSFPSGLPGSESYGQGDIEFAKQVVEYYNPNTTFKIYLPFSKETINYTPNSVKSDFKYFNKGVSLLTLILFYSTLFLIIQD